MRVSVTLLFMLLIAVSSCSDSLGKHGDLFSQFMLTEEGLFRGVELGDPYEKVTSAEKELPIKSDKTFLLFSGALGKSGVYSIRYGFEEGNLFEILVDAEFSDVNEGIDLLNGFRSYFNERYGLYIKDGGYLVWKGNSKDNPDSVIEMIDESEFTDFGQFTLSFYPQPSATTPQEINSEASS
ncbi:MAG: hypothetical protein WED33_03865 [Bacteroidia bacterium]